VRIKEVSKVNEKYPGMVLVIIEAALSAGIVPTQFK
jgi:hypothetical protein